MKYHVMVFYVKQLLSLNCQKNDDTNVFAAKEAHLVMNHYFGDYLTTVWQQVL